MFSHAIRCKTMRLESLRQIYRTAWQHDKKGSIFIQDLDFSYCNQGNLETHEENEERW